MAHDEGVRDLHTHCWKIGEAIADGDLSAGVDSDELWDDIYIPNENEYKPHNVTGRTAESRVESNESIQTMAWYRTNHLV